MDALEALRTRRSVRAYTREPVAKADVEQMVDCARLAATAINIQPWEFVAITDATMLSRVANATDHGHHIADAPLCVAVFCKDGTYFLEDGCAATQNLLVAANALGYAGCWIAGDKKDYAAPIRDMLAVPAEYRLVSLVPIGRPVDKPNPPKRPLDEVLHWERF